MYKLLLLILCHSLVHAGLADRLQSKSSLKVEVQILGIEAELLKNAQAYLSLLAKKDRPEFNEIWLHNLYRQGINEIQKSLQPFGYYSAQVQSELKKIASNQWQVIYRVDRGPPVKLRSVKIEWTGEGQNEARLQQASAAFPLKQGDVLQHDLYEKGKKALLQAANELGYPDAKPELAQILVNPSQQSADIHLKIATGQKYRIGSIQLHQNILQEELVLAYLNEIKSGSIYSEQVLLAIQQSLVESGYFSLVDIKPNFRAAQGQELPLEIYLKPAKRQRYSVGIGYDTDIGLNLNFRWLHRRLNRYGHKANAQLKLSTKESKLQLDYWIPNIKDPRNSRYGITASLENEKTADTDRQTFNLEAAYYFKWHQDYLARFYSQYKYERYQIDAEDYTTYLFSLGAWTQYSWFEEARFVRRGWGFDADIRLSPGLISQTAYIRSHIKGVWLYPLGQKGRLFTRAELGLAQAQDFEYYPSSLRFYAGGSQSVRGYDWKSLGPKSAAGEVIGGRQVFTSSLEYDHRLLEDWVMAVFIDAGNAFNDDLNKLYFGAGLGARWLSPIGSVVLDFAWPINQDSGRTEFADIQFYFGFEVTL